MHIFVKRKNKDSEMEQDFNKIEITQERKREKVYEYRKLLSPKEICIELGVSYNLVLLVIYGTRTDHYGIIDLAYNNICKVVSEIKQDWI